MYDNRSSSGGAGRNPNEYTYVEGYGFTPPPPQLSERRRLRSYASALGMAMMGFLLLSMVLPGMVYNLLSFFIPTIRLYNFQVIAPPAISELAKGISYVLSLTIPFGLYAMFVRIPTESALPMRRPNWELAIPSVAIVLGVTVVGVFSSMALSGVCQLAGYLPTTPDLAPPEGGLAVFFFVINSVILPAFLEEMVFRGVVMQSLRRFGDSFALLVSAILFAVVHGNLVQAPNAFLAGLAIGYFVLRTSSLWTGIVFHFVNNGMAVFVSMLTASSTERFQTLIIYSVYAVYIIIGVVMLMAVLKNHNDLFTFAPCSSTLPERRKYSAFFGSVGMAAALVVFSFVATRYMIAIG